MKKWFRYMAVLSAVALLGAACAQEDEPTAGGDGDGETQEKVDVTVYAQGAITGDFNYLVIHSVNAAKMRAQELSEDPEFPATITVEDADTQGDPEQVPPVAQTVVGDPNTVAVIGPHFSGESEAAGDTYNEAGIPFVSPSATNPGLADQDWDYWYRTIANDADQGTPMGEWMAAQHSSIFIVHDVSTYGQGLAEVVQEVAEQEGAEVAGFEGIEATEDYSALITQIEDAGAEAVFYGGYDAQTGLIVAQMRDAGVDIPVYSGDGSVSSTLLDLAGDAATDVFLSCPCNLEGSTEFLAQFEEEFGETGVPVYAAEGYDAMSLVGEGIASAIEGGNEDPESIREGIKEYLDGVTADNPFEGVAKSIAFDPETHELAAENRSDLIYFYEVQPGEMTLLGSATEVLAEA
ncbi:MAG TPA: branched-chain amino acid ABC transporter substrate-binding protein [Actinomycetota bacterium]|nr:branched-chain amino acid ABC transporter substrate-binding protein [Actinomycetota bacterium]